MPLKGETALTSVGGCPRLKINRCGLDCSRSMTLEQSNLVTAQLLIPGLISLLAVTLLATLFAVIYHRSRRAASAAGDSFNPAWAQQYRPSIFEQPCRWLVVRSSQVSAVQAALRLHNATPCSWGEGMSRLAGQSLFVSPPIRGWILVVGEGLPDPSQDIDRCFHFLAKFSRALGEVQFFNVNRAVNHHAWAKVEQGTVRRAYAWAGETLWNQGELTQPEIDLGMKCYGYGEMAESFQITPGDMSLPNSEKVLALAGRWSFDPAAIHDTDLQAGVVGIAGDLARPSQL